MVEGEAHLGQLRHLHSHFRGGSARLVKRISKVFAERDTDRRIVGYQRDENASADTDEDRTRSQQIVCLIFSQVEKYVANRRIHGSCKGEAENDAWNCEQECLEYDRRHDVLRVEAERSQHPKLEGSLLDVRQHQRVDQQSGKYSEEGRDCNQVCVKKVGHRLVSAHLAEQRLRSRDVCGQGHGVGELAAEVRQFFLGFIELLDIKVRLLVHYAIDCHGDLADVRQGRERIDLPQERDLPGDLVELRSDEVIDRVAVDQHCVTQS